MIEEFPPEREKEPEWKALRVIPPPGPTQNQITWVLILLFALVAIIGWNHIRPAQKWEYKIESVKDVSFSSDMDKLGDDGWELVFARRATESTSVDVPGKKPEFMYEMVFRRPKR